MVRGAVRFRPCLQTNLNIMNTKQVTIQEVRAYYVCKTITIEIPTQIREGAVGDYLQENSELWEDELDNQFNNLSIDDFEYGNDAFDDPSNERETIFESIKESGNLI